MYKKIVLLAHFIFLGIVLISLLGEINWRTSLIVEIDLVLRLLVFLSGLILFIKYIKPFRIQALYFSLYGLTILTSLIGITVKGIFGAILLSFSLSIFTPNFFMNAMYNYNNFRVYENSVGLFNACCSYKVSERKYIIFEYEIGHFSAENLSGLEEVKVMQESSSISLTYSFDEFDVLQQNYIEKDTTIFFPLPLNNE